MCQGKHGICCIEATTISVNTNTKAFFDARCSSPSLLWPPQSSKKSCLPSFWLYSRDFHHLQVRPAPPRPFAFNSLTISTPSIYAFLCLSFWLLLLGIFKLSHFTTLERRRAPSAYIYIYKNETLVNSSSGGGGSDTQIAPASNQHVVHMP